MAILVDEEGADGKNELWKEDVVAGYGEGARCERAMKEKRMRDADYGSVVQRTADGYDAFARNGGK